MAELPYMKLFPGDYLMDTRHLTLEEHGAYLMLLMQYWTQGHSLLDDDKRFAALLGVSLKKWKSLRGSLEEFFLITDGVWEHKRVEKEMASARNTVLGARKAGLASGKARKSSNGRSTDVQRKSNGRSTKVEQKGQRKGNAGGNVGRTNHSHSHKTPLTPLSEDSSNPSRSSPAPSGGRVDRGGDAKQVGDILGKIEKGKD